MPAGETFTADQRHEIDKAIREADRVVRPRVLGPRRGSEGDSRRTAELLHAALPRPGNSILIFVDPVARSLEIVTGADVRADPDQPAGGARRDHHAVGVRHRRPRPRPASGLAQLARLATPVTASTPTRPDLRALAHATLSG